MFDWPDDGKLTVPGLANTVTKAFLLADKQQATLKTSRADEDVIVELPEEAPDVIDTVVVLGIEGDAGLVRRAAANAARNIEREGLSQLEHPEDTGEVRAFGGEGACPVAVSARIAKAPSRPLNFALLLLWRPQTSWNFPAFC